LISTIILSFQRKLGALGPHIIFYIFEAPGLHFWRFLAKANLQTNNILTNSKQNTFPLDYFYLQDPSTVRKQTELPLHCV
jgi:hypothetical protein